MGVVVVVFPVCSRIARLWCGAPLGRRKCALCRRISWRTMCRSTWAHCRFMPTTTFCRSSMSAMRKRNLTSQSMLTTLTDVCLWYVLCVAETGFCCGIIWIHFAIIIVIYYAPAIKWCRDPSVCLFHLSQLSSQHLGQATRAVRTADPPVHGLGSAVIGAGLSSRRALTCL